MTSPQQLPQQTSVYPPQALNSGECEVYFSGKHDALYIYLSRLLAPIWDQQLLIELNTASTSGLLDTAGNSNGNNFVFATFNEINIQWYLNKLNELRKFIDTSFVYLKQFQTSQSGCFLAAGLFAATSSSASSLTTTTTPASPGASQQRQPHAKQQLNPNQPRYVTQYGTLPLNMSALVSLLNSSNQRGSASEDKLAAEIEAGSVLLVRAFISRLVEIFGLWKILDDHKFVHFVVLVFIFAFLFLFL